MAEGQDPSAALPAEFVAEINAFSEDIFNYYISNRSAEDYAADNEKTKKFFSDEEYKGKMMKEMTDAFTAADANQDGLLDQQEFRAFQGTLIQAAKDRGDYTDDRQESNDKWYTLCSKVNSETNGMSMVDFFTVMGVSIKK